jgi:murein L,D-transpeptidase YcbB/YkuD
LGLWIAVKKLLLAATVLTALLPSAADAKKKRPAPAPPPVVRVAPTDPVEAYYFHRGDAPIWLRDPATRAAAGRLSAILKRSTIDGFAYGPQLGLQVDSALAQAASGDPAAVKAAEVTLSKAWVAYIQYLRTPPKGMIYGYDLLRPHSRPDQILLTTAAAPNLLQQVDRMADVNPVYRNIRDAAIASGQTVADVRLLANLERARVLPSTGLFVIVDAATARLTMYENGQPVDSMKVVVGTPETPTPMIGSVIHYLTLNPYWNVPPNLIRKTVGPSALKQGNAYLKPRGYEVMSGWTADAVVLPADKVDWKAVIAGQQDVRVRQLPGPGNSMGKMKVPFPSGVDIYLHDTPSREKFALAQRQQSNGCIRLEDARRLGRWLMGSDPAAASKDPEQFVQLPQGVPIFLTYLTAQVDGGKLAYLNDIYGWDTQPERQIAAGQYTPPAGTLR